MNAMLSVVLILLSVDQVGEPSDYFSTCTNMQATRDDQGRIIRMEFSYDEITADEIIAEYWEDDEIYLEAIDENYFEGCGPVDYSG